MSVTLSVFQVVALVVGCGLISFAVGAMFANARTWKP